MDIFTTACIGILLNAIYFLALNVFVPKAYRVYYCKQKKDIVSLAAVTLYHGIWVAWLVGGMPPVASGNAVVGTMTFLAGMTLTLWAQRVNPYFAPTVIIPMATIRSGPYRYLNHQPTTDNHNQNLIYRLPG